jgi:hypothetical protein
VDSPLYDLADQVPLTVQITDAAGVPADAGSVVLTITLPDGSTVSPAVSSPSTGKYQVDFVPSMPGRHSVKWVASGANASAFSDVFDVRAAFPPYIVSLLDTKRHLNLSSSVDDEELRSFIEAATRVVENVVGPVVVRSVSEVHASPGRLLVLGQTPVLSLTSISPVSVGGVSYSSTDVDVDLATGVVRLLSGRRFAGPLRVVYTAGRVSVPASMTLAAKLIIGQMWETQRGHSQGQRRLIGRSLDVDEGLSSSSTSSVLIPRRALELLEPDQRMPVMA